MSTSPDKRRQMGQRNEELAVEYLVEHGYRVVETNYTIRSGEIDIIAYHEQTLCFIEVRSRSHERFGSPLESVNRTKQRRIINAARYYLMRRELEDVPVRFDVLGITMKPLTYQLVRHAFECEE